MAKITKRDIEDLESKMMTSFQRIIRDENQKLIEEMKRSIDNMKQEVAELKAAQEHVPYQIDKAIISESLELQAKKRELYFTGTTMSGALDIIQGILGEEPNVKFKRAFKRGDEPETNGIIGLDFEQCARVLTEKAEFMRKNDSLNNVSIRQAMTRRQARVRKQLQSEMTEKNREAPHGKKFVIRYGEVVMVNDLKAGSSPNSKNGHMA